MSLEIFRESVSGSGIVLRPIGLVHSPHADPAGTPPHPRMASGFCGELDHWDFAREACG